MYYICGGLSKLVLLQMTIGSTQINSVNCTYLGAYPMVLELPLFIYIYINREREQKKWVYTKIYSHSFYISFYHTNASTIPKSETGCGPFIRE